MSPDRLPQNDDPLSAALPELQNFSLILGGLLYQFFRRARLDDDTGLLVRRRVLVVSGFIWLPLLVLCAIDGTLFGGVKVPLFPSEAGRPAAYNTPWAMSKVLPLPPTPRTRTGRIFTCQLTPVPPTPSLPAAPIVPAV